jgi:hypothetical protein
MLSWCAFPARRVADRELRAGRSGRAYVSGRACAGNARNTENFASGRPAGRAAARPIQDQSSRYACSARSAPRAAAGDGPRIGAIFDIERGINGQSAEERLRVRKEQSAPLLATLEAWLREQRARLSNSSSVAKPIYYMLRRWDRFARIEDGRVCLTNNAAERALRGFASLESLCAPSLSACKHWKRVRVNFATRATLSGNRRFDRLGRQIGSPNLTGRSWNNLHSRKNAAGDKAADHMT